jgi:plastocyanin
MSFSRYLGIGAILVGFTLATAPGCGSSSSSNTGGAGGGATGGAGGGATGGAGGATGGAGGGGGSAFMSVAPCSAETDYMSTGTITASGISYSPKCVKVSKGGSVKFMMDFTIHPLRASKMRGNTTSNPIKDTDTGMESTVTFPDAGFFAFYCNVHGPADDGKNMAGVIWVQ